MNEDEKKQAEMVTRAINAESIEELKSLYDDWAITYDDYVGELDYVAPQLAATLLATALPDKSALILDVGCGTGLVGSELAALGYGRIHGNDLSKGMLEVATLTGHYLKLKQVDMTRLLPQDSATYGATICIGALGIHIGTEAVDEMIRLTRPGGMVVISVRDPYYEPSGYKTHLHKLAEDGRIQLLVEEQKAYILDEGATAHYILMKVL